MTVKITEKISRSAIGVLVAALLFPPFAAGEPAERGAGKRSTAPAILSIAPAGGEPGTVVVLFGSGFTEMTRVFLGEREVAATVSGEKQLGFRVPDLNPGTYALFLRREDGAVSRVYNFSVHAATPEVESLEPDRMDGCGAPEGREITVRGSKFRESTQVLLDGAIIRSRFLSPEAVAATIPGIAGGLHSVQVKNPGAPPSPGVALFMDVKPEITGVSRGEESVNYYNLIIEGRNFRGDSRVVVDGKSLSPSSAGMFERERVRFVDCTRMVYERHPYDRTVKQFSVQIINPDGGESSVFRVSAP